MIIIFPQVGTWSSAPVTQTDPSPGRSPDAPGTRSVVSRGSLSPPATCLQACGAVLVREAPSGPGPLLFLMSAPVHRLVRSPRSFGASVLPEKGCTGGDSFRTYMSRCLSLDSHLDDHFGLGCWISCTHT